MTIDATFYSPATTSGSGISARAGIGLTSITGTYTLPSTSDLDTNDLIKMVHIPAGATVLEVIVDIPATGIDTSTGLEWTVGDDGDEARYISANTTGRSSAGGIVRMNVGGGGGYKYTADNTIDIKISAGATTNVTSGTVKLTVIYTMDA